MALEFAFRDEICAEALSDARLLAAMARFEAALALACAQAGLVSRADAEAIARACATATFDAAQIAREGRRAGTLAIPFVKRLTEQVAAVSSEAARWVHFGATSQDAIDTALVLCLKEAGARIQALAHRTGEAAAKLTREHRQTPTVSRTLLQPAVPVPFGWKTAVWLSMLARSLAAFRSAAREARVLQFGGAGGTLSAYGDKGDALAAALAKELDLPVAPVTWHSTRDGFARLGSEAAILAGAAGKIARDVSLLMQPEVGEAFEPHAPGRGGSSSLPHKRNPVGCLAALEAASRAPALAATLLAQLAPEHERGLGQWQGQWLTLRDLLSSTAGGLAAIAEVLEGIELDREAMRANLDRTRGLVFSEAVALRLSAALSKPEAHALTEKLCEAAAREGITLREALERDPQAARIVPAGELQRLFDPQAGYGSAAMLIERALELWRQSAKPPAR